MKICIICFTIFSHHHLKKGWESLFFLCQWVIQTNRSLLGRLRYLSEQHFSLQPNHISHFLWRVWREGNPCLWRESTFLSSWSESIRPLELSPDAFVRSKDPNRNCPHFHIWDRKSLAELSWSFLRRVAKPKTGAGKQNFI